MPNQAQKLTKKKIGQLELAQEIKMVRTAIGPTNKITDESDQFNCMYEMVVSRDVSELDQFGSRLQIGDNQVQCFGLHFYGSLN